MERLGKALGRLAVDEEDYWEEDGYEEDCDYGDGAGDGDGVENGRKTAAAENDAVAGDVCAVCLNAIQPEDLAIIKGCEHMYCVNCILQWALCKEASWCPQCKKPFNYLYCHRLLDGSLSDEPVEESVCLLKRATWFVEHVTTLDKGKAVSAAMAAEELPAEWADSYFDEGYDDGYDEEEEIEKYYFSSAAGAARVVLGNRRLGENGYMRAGRVYARPVHNNSAGPSAGSGSGGIGKAGKGGTAAGGSGSAGQGGSSSSSKPPGGAGGSGGAGSSGAGPSGSSSSAGGQSKGQGRRAKRNARRAASDAM